MTQFFRKIYLSLYLKGFKRVTKGITVWEVSWRLNRTATYWPTLLWPYQRFFPVLLGCSTGGLGAQPLWNMFLIPASSLQLTDFLFSPGLYNFLTTTFLWASQIALNSTHLRSRLYPDIPQPDAPVIYTGAFPILTAWPGSICYICPNPDEYVGHCFKGVTCYLVKAALSWCWGSPVFTSRSQSSSSLRWPFPQALTILGMARFMSGAWGASF